MGSGKHSSDEEIEFDFGYVKNLMLIVVILAVIVGVIFGVYTLVHKMKETKAEPTSAEEEVVENEYEVLGKIKIDKIGVEQPILETVEEEALEKGVIKLYGEDLNQEGNFCIAGHNYENIFKKLDEMEIGDEIEIVDADQNSTQYKITEISSVEPTDLNLLRKEEGKTQITLITCENYSTKRLIVKAEMDK